jgi:hypothetical protein
MSSVGYFPPAVWRVDLPKGDGRSLPSGIPRFADCIAKMVVKRFLEPLVEPMFDRDSYGYRLGKSAPKPLEWRAGGAGVTHGFCIWISRLSSTASGAIC